MPIYNGRTRISDENIWRVVDIKTTTVTSALYESLEENIQEDLQIGDFVLEITEVNQYISDDDVLDNKINNINVPNGEIRKTYAVILSKENYNKLQYLTGFTTNTSYSTLGSLRNDIDNLETNIVYLIRNNDKYDEYILAGSGNNKELVKIGDTSVTFDSSNLVDLSEFLQLRTDLKQSHDELSNRISSNATNISENTNNIQNLTNETLSIKNNLNNVEADMTTVKKEVWGSNTTTGDSRIDILEETTQKKERTEIDYLNMGTTTDPGYYNVVNQNGNGFSITYKTSENGASSTIENITKAPMDVYSAILNGVSYVMQRIIIGDKTYTRYLNVSSNTTSPWMAEPVVTNTITNTPNKIPTTQAVINYVPNPSSTTPSADTTSGSVGTSTAWARSDHTHPKSSLYAESTHRHSDADITTLGFYGNLPQANHENPSQQQVNSAINSAMGGKEDNANKVTSLSSSSTDTQYPSAKCVYDTVDIVDDKVSVVYNPVSIIDTSDSVYDADRWTEYGTMGIGQMSNQKFIAGGGTGYVIYDGNISNLDNYDITLNLTPSKTNTHVYINDNDIGTLPTSQTSILFKKRNGVVKVVYDNNQYDASAVQIISFNVLNKIRYTIDIVLYQGMIYDVIDSIPSKTSDLTNDSGYLTAHQNISGKEDKSNKVTSISSSSTDTEYPSAKAVFDSLPSVPSASSVTPSADTTNGSVGDGTTWARSNHTHPKSSLYAEANHTHSEYVNPTIVDNLNSTSATSVLSAKQGKVLNDLIGDAISYINGTGGS